MEMLSNLKSWFSQKEKQQEDSRNALSLIEDGHQITDIPTEQITQEICLIAVQKNPGAIAHLAAEQRTPAVCLAAVQQNVSVASLLKEEELDEDVLCAVLWERPITISEIPEDVLTERMLHTAFVRDRTGDILALATSTHGDASRLQQLWQKAQEHRQAVNETIQKDIVSNYQNRQDRIQFIPMPEDGSGENQSLFDAKTIVMGEGFLNFSPRQHAPSPRERGG
jgi:hypothetical protein